LIIALCLLVAYFVLGAACAAAVMAMLSEPEGRRTWRLWELSLPEKIQAVTFCVLAWPAVVLRNVDKFYPSGQASEDEPPV
jgi:hypothetical protein